MIRLLSRTVLSLVASAGLMVGPAFAAPETAPPALRSAATQAVRALDLSYQVFAGGLHIFDFDVELALRDGAYTIAAQGATKGMVGWIYKWNVKMESEGIARSDGFRPFRYDTVTDWQGEPKSMRLTFLPRGEYDVARTPPEPVDAEDEEELPKALPADVVDPLSLALVAAQSLAETGRCDQTLPVFDGKRRYNLIIGHLGKGHVEPNRYSIYHGPAVRCRFAMERISGFSKKRRYASQWDEEKDAPPVIWLAKVREGFPPVPVRYEGTIALGNIVIHLTRAEVRAEVAEVPTRQLPAQ